MSTDKSFLNFPISSQMWEGTRVGWGQVQERQERKEQEAGEKCKTLTFSTLLTKQDPKMLFDLYKHLLRLL